MSEENFTASIRTNSWTRILAAAICSTLWFAAAEADPGEALSQTKSYRALYSNSPDLPDGIAFRETMRLLDFMVSEHGRASAVGLLQYDLGLSAPTAERLLDDLLATFESYNSALDDVKWRMICSHRPAGDRIYALYESIDDADDALADQYLATTLATLEDPLPARLNQWLDVRKQSIVHVKMRYKEHYQRMGADPEAKRAGVCDRISRSTARVGERER
ncbi:MAG: hypothetical protein KJO82_05730 [Gammaproteobacteria bacterium]|nr:hypothetical protein [Gammaproteobacteria bacterium]